MTNPPTYETVCPAHLAPETPAHDDTPHRKGRIVALACICGVSVLLNIWGIRVGLPSQERLDVSLGGSEAVERVKGKIAETLESRIADRSEFVGKQEKAQLASLSPYFDQLRTFHPDEQYILKVLGRMARDRDIHPRSYIYGPFFFYQIGAGVAVGRLLRMFPAKTDVLYFLGRPHEFAPAYLSARLVCALFATATVALTFLIGLRLRSLKLACVASLFLAFLPLTVLSAKFIKPDAPAMFWSTLSLFFAVVAAERGRWRDYLLSGVCVGLAAGSKYPAALCGAYLLAFHLQRRVQGLRQGEYLCRQDLKPVGAGLISIVIFAVTNPSCLLDRTVFLRDFRWISHVLRQETFLANLWDGVICYSEDALFYTMGPAGALAAAAGIVLVLTRRGRAWWAFLPAIALFFVFACQGRPGSDGYMLPVYPAIALLSARALLLPKRKTLRIALAGLTLAVTFSYAVAYDWVASGENARMTAARWINANVPPGSTIGTLQYPVGYRMAMVSPERYRLVNCDFDPLALQADWFVDSSFEWQFPDWRDRLAGRAVTGRLPAPEYRRITDIEAVPRVLFGLIPLRRDHALSPYIEVVAPRITIYRRERH